MNWNKVRCFFGHHCWFMNPTTIEREPGSAMIWSHIIFRVCTSCGYVKAVIQGRNDSGRIRIIDGCRVQEYGKKVNW